MRTLARGRASPILILVYVLTASLAFHQVGSAAPLCDPADFRFVIDVGHTRSAPGAMSARGKTEFSFNLELGQRIQRTAQAAGYHHTYLFVTETDQRAQLAARSARANAVKPNLFLSVHHDDVQPRYHAKWMFEGRQRSYSDRFSGHSIFVSSENREFDASLRFAKLLGAELAGHGLRYSPHHAENIPGERRPLIDRDLGIYRYDGLHVLRAVNAPAVLLEAGIITNRDEELSLGSAERRDLLSEAVLVAVRRFCLR